MATRLKQDLGIRLGFVVVDSPCWLNRKLESVALTVSVLAKGKNTSNPDCSKTAAECNFGLNILLSLLGEMRVLHFLEACH